MGETYNISIPPEQMPISAKDLQVIITAQQESEVRLMHQVSEFGRLLVALEERNRNLQRLIETRLTVTSAQAMALQKAVAKRARVLCAMNDLEYSTCGGKVRAAIYRALKQEYTVSAYGDIPAALYASALDIVNEWTSFELIRKLKTKK